MIDERRNDHLSEAQIGAVADGQERDESLLAHVDGCEVCAGFVAEHALLSARLSPALRDLRAAAASEPARLAPRAVPFVPPRMPVGALAAAMALAVVLSIPGLWSGQALGRSLASARIVLHGQKQLALAAMGQSPGLGWSIALTILFCITGVGIARWGMRRDAARRQEEEKHGYA
mgnify:CR=1 FL=1